MINSYKIFRSKTFEKVVNSHVTKFLEDNHGCFKYPFGFRKKIIHAILALVEKLSNALDNGKYVVGVFLDHKNI